MHLAIDNWISRYPQISGGTLALLGLVLTLNLNIIR
jgi:hypothetical protein